MTHPSSRSIRRPGAFLFSIDPIQGGRGLGRDRRSMSSEALPVCK